MIQIKIQIHFDLKGSKIANKSRSRDYSILNPTSTLASCYIVGEPSKGVEKGKKQESTGTICASRAGS